MESAQVLWDSATKHIIITTTYTNTFTTQREIPYLQTPASLFWRCLTFNKLQNILERGVFPLILTNQMITEKFSHYAG